MTVVSKAWNQLSAVQRKPFEESANKDKVRALEERKVYESTLPPKKPLTGFLLFLKDFRANNKDQLQVTEIIKKGSEAWKLLQVAVRENYNAQSKQALEAWKKKYANK